MLTWCERLALNEVHIFIKHALVARHLYVVCNTVCKPNRVIRNPRSNAHACGGKPPMLEIAFNKLPGGGPQDMFACNGRASGQQGH